MRWACVGGMASCAVAGGEGSRLAPSGDLQGLVLTAVIAPGKCQASEFCNVRIATRGVSKVRHTTLCLHEAEASRQGQAESEAEWTIVLRIVPSSRAWNQM